MVRVKTANTSDEMVALMNEGGFDVVTASGDASLRLIAGKRVQEVNIYLVPSWHTIDDRLMQAPWHTVDGKHYGTPYMWGPNVLMYNTDVFPEPPESWEVVFREMTLPDGQSNKGRVQAYDGPIHVADAALFLMHHEPDLGIENPYELNQDQYAAALDLLREQRKIVGRYWHSAFNILDLHDHPWPRDILCCRRLQQCNRPIPPALRLADRGVFRSRSHGCPDLSLRGSSEPVDSSPRRRDARLCSLVRRGDRHHVHGRTAADPAHMDARGTRATPSAPGDQRGGHGGGGGDVPAYPRRLLSHPRNTGFPIHVMDRRPTGSAWCLDSIAEPVAQGVASHQERSPP